MQFFFLNGPQNVTGDATGCTMRSALRARADRGSASVHVISVLVLLHVCGRDGARALAGQRSLPSTEGCTARAIGREKMGSGHGGD